MQLQQINVKLELDQEVDPRTAAAQEFGTSLDLEIREFDQWFRSQGNGPLVLAEMAMLKTYLAWKIRYEKAVLDASDTEGSDG